MKHLSLRSFTAEKEIQMYMTTQIYHSPLILIISVYHVENHIVEKNIDGNVQYVNNDFMIDVFLSDNTFR